MQGTRRRPRRAPRSSRAAAVGCRSRRSARKRARSRVLQPARSRHSSARRTTRRRFGCGARAAAGRRHQTNGRLVVGECRQRRRDDSDRRPRRSAKQSRVRVSHPADPGDRAEGVEPEQFGLAGSGRVPDRPEEHSSPVRIGSCGGCGSVGQQNTSGSQANGGNTAGSDQSAVTADLMPAVASGEGFGPPHRRALATKEGEE